MNVIGITNHLRFTYLRLNISKNNILKKSIIFQMNLLQRKY